MTAEQVLDEIAGTPAAPDPVEWKPAGVDGAGGDVVYLPDGWYYLDPDLGEIGPYGSEAEARAALAADERRRALVEIDL